MLQNNGGHVKGFFFTQLAVVVLICLLSAPAWTADNAVRVMRVILYKHGVGYFERQAKLDSTSAVTLEFRAPEISNVLKSMTLLTPGGSVGSVSYEASDPLEKQLREYSLSLPAGAAPTSQALYRAPDDVLLELVPKGEPATSSREIVLMGKVKVLIGQPSDTTIRYLSSPDLSVKPAKAAVPTLAAGAEWVFEVKVRPGKGAAKGSSWVKMLLTYRPDGAAISAAVSADLKAYPNELLRERLLKSIAERKDPVNRAVGHLFLKPPFAGNM